MPKIIDKYSIESTDYSVGQDNVQRLGFDIHNPVFGICVSLIGIFLMITLVCDPIETKVYLNHIKWLIIKSFDWLFMWSGNIFLIFSIFLILSPLGNIRIGGKHSTPDFNLPSWFAMLFAAGMGIGLMFWSVAEPVSYYTGIYGTPLNVTPNTPEAQALALGATMFHWGLHPWAMYGIVALALSFFAYNKGLPLSIRSVFYPIVGDLAWGWIGHIVDILAVLATLFGLATSLAQGALQASSGIHYIFNIDSTTTLQISVIIAVIIFATFSVYRGVDGGVKILSNLNMFLALCLLISIIIFSFDHVFANIWLTFKSYITNIIPLSNPHNRADNTWLQSWTVFYWAWWLSYSPCVGVFIARISKGRTIRQLLTAVLIVPTAITLIWMAVFGGGAIEQVIGKQGILGTTGISDISVAMFEMFDYFEPFSTLFSLIAIVLVLVFFITSSDSGSLVVDSITAGGKTHTPAPQRIFWSLLEGAIAIALLWIGGKDSIDAMQAAVICTALPFTVILLFMCVSLLKGISTEERS